MNRAVFVLAAAFLTAAPALAETCTAPVAPRMATPGGSLSVDEFNAVTIGLTAYDDATRNYRSCLDAILEAPQDHTRESWSAALTAYNAISADQQSLYERYDVVARDFQAAQASRAIQAAHDSKAASVIDSQAQLAEELASLNGN